MRTTPGIWPAATIPWGGGSGTASLPVPVTPTAGSVLR
jgi:hypothetical protein